MNRNLDLVYTFTRWFHEHPDSDETRKMDSRLQVPFICEFVAMRWSYEELVVAQAKLNPLTKRQDEAQRQIDAIVARHESSPGDPKRLDDLKETLAVLSGLEAKTPRELEQYLAMIDRVLSGKMPFRRAAFKNAERTDHGRATLREPEGLRSDRERRDGTKRLSARRKTECFLRRSKSATSERPSAFSLSTPRS